VLRQEGCQPKGGVGNTRNKLGMACLETGDAVNLASQSVIFVLVTTLFLTTLVHSRLGGGIGWGLMLTMR
jgi:hypothetical protein